MKNSNIDKISNIDIMYNIFALLDIKDFMRYALCSRLTNKIPKESDFWLMIVKSTLTVEIDTVLLRLGYSISIINNLSADKVDCIELLAKLHLPRKCSRSGCFQIFKEIDNSSSSCRFHSGRMKGLSGLSCCRSKSFTSALGCKISHHDGSFFDTVYSVREELPIVNKNQSEVNKTKNKVLINTKIGGEIKLPKINIAS